MRRRVRNTSALLPARTRSGCRPGMLIFPGMRTSLSAIVALACAALVLGAAATASARPKKSSDAPAARSTEMCIDNAIIVQSPDCVRPSARTLQPQPVTDRAPEEQPQPTERAQRRRVTTRGSSGAYAPAPLPAPSLNLPPSSQGVYIPPPVANPSAQINQLNQSFQFNRGIGNNPMDRDSFIRQNMTR